MTSDTSNLPGPPGFEQWYDSKDHADRLWDTGPDDGTFVSCQHCEEYNSEGCGMYGKDGDVLPLCSGCDGLLNWAPKIGWEAHCKQAPVADGDEPWSVGR